MRRPWRNRKNPWAAYHAHYGDPKGGYDLHRTELSYASAKKFIQKWGKPLPLAFGVYHKMGKSMPQKWYSTPPSRVMASKRNNPMRSRRVKLGVLSRQSRSAFKHWLRAYKKSFFHKHKTRKSWAKALRRQEKLKKKFLKLEGVIAGNPRSVRLPSWRSMPKKIRDIVDAEIRREFGGGRKRRRSRRR